MKPNLDDMTPKEIVEALDTYIIGQEKAKKAVAIALRNRLRRQCLPEDMRDEVAPKNIIMIGPTGVGKTEIARRLARLCKAPFIKVEATKYTEVGYVGRDVESMVRDLMSVSVSLVKKELEEGVHEEAERRTEEQLLDILLPGIGGKEKSAGTGVGFQTDEPALSAAAGAAKDESGRSTRDKFRKMLRDGKLEEKEVEVTVTKANNPAIEIFSGANFEEMGMNLGGLGNMFGSNKKKRKVTVSKAREILMAEEVDKLIDSEKLSELARDRVQQMGIIFVDEIDKIAVKDGRSGGDVSREGVQRDILPIVEGAKVNTKQGLVDTSHILFIAAGAFHMSKPSDLIPELQGRFPIRVELEDLGVDQFEEILKQPKNALTKQYVELMATEEVTLRFTAEGIRRMSEIAAEVNSRTENIGARRLHTIMEHLLEEVSFNAPDLAGQTIEITPHYVDERLNNVIEDKDLSRYIL